MTTLLCFNIKKLSNQIFKYMSLKSLHGGSLIHQFQQILETWVHHLVRNLIFKENPKTYPSKRRWMFFKKMEIYVQIMLYLVWICLTTTYLEADLHQVSLNFEKLCILIRMRNSSASESTLGNRMILRSSKTLILTSN